MELKVKDKFKKLIPPLGEEEYQQLEANIIADGCRDPIVIWNGTIVDGHNRYEICGRHNVTFATTNIEFDDDDAACIWIIQNQFGRRNLAPFTRVELIEKLKPLIAEKNRMAQVEGGKNKVPQNSGEAPKQRETDRQLAKMAGVSHDTIAKGRILIKHADEETKQKLRTNQVSIHRVAKDIKEEQQKKSRQQKRSEAAKSIELDERIIVGDFRQNADKIPDGSVSLIFTDPPYDRKALDMFPELAQFAKAKLCDGGSMLCYVGHIQLIEAINAISTHLRYWWVVACVHSGGNILMNEYGIRTHWKAVLWFVKGTRHDKNNIVHDVMSGGTEKQFHDWQQSQSEAEYWINALTENGDIVCDPFLGGGTTAAAAEKLNRRWIGFELDEDNARISSERIVSA